MPVDHLVVVEARPGKRRNRTAAKSSYYTVLVGRTLVARAMQTHDWSGNAHALHHIVVSEEWTDSE